MGKLSFQSVRSIEQIKKITKIAYYSPLNEIVKIQEMA